MYLVLAILRESMDDSQYVEQHGPCAGNPVENELSAPPNQPIDEVNRFNDGAFSCDEDMDDPFEGPVGGNRRELAT